jgi:hypothetical protein
LAMGSVAEVEQAHREFATKRKEIAITELGDIHGTNGKVNFIFSDLDKNWWELTAESTQGGRG